MFQKASVDAVSIGETLSGGQWEAKGALSPDLASYHIVTYDPTNLGPLKSQMSKVLSYQASKLTE